MFPYITQPSRLLLARTTSQTLRRWDSSALAQTRYGDVGADLAVCLRLRYGHSESVLPQNFSLLDSHASSLRPDSAGERRQVRFAPCELRSGRVVRRGRRGAVERSSSSSSSSWSLERRKAVSLQAQAREAKRLKIMQASTRFGLARTKCKVQSAKCKIQNRLRQNRRLRNPEAKRDRGTLTGTGTGMGMGADCRPVCTNGNLKLVNKTPASAYDSAYL